MIGRIWKGLGFQAKAGVLFGKEVAGVKLQAGLIGENFKGTAAFWVSKDGRK